jgi:hypothetical protein
LHFDQLLVKLHSEKAAHTWCVFSLKCVFCLQIKDEQYPVKPHDRANGQKPLITQGLKQSASIKVRAGAGVAVGLDARVEQLIGSLSTLENRMMLLHGMAGTGKTLLAKAVLDQLHEDDPTLQRCVMKVPPGLQDVGRAVVSAQAMLLHDLAGVEVPVVSPEQGCRLLARELRGKKIVLLVDSVWGRQLELMLPDNLLELLATGSMVMVTSRSSWAAREFGRQPVTAVEMELLSEMESMELLCRYAFGSIAPPAGEEDKVRAVVAKCGGVEMAVEVVGRHLAGLTDTTEFWSNVDAALSVLFQDEKCGRLEAERTVFAALKVSWDVLSVEEQQQLLNVVWFLRGVRWDLVQSFCPYGVLEQLDSMGLVKTGRLADDSLAAESAREVMVPEVLVSFCKADVLGIGGQRLQLHGTTPKAMLEVRC